MAKMVNVIVIWNSTEEETWLNIDRILSIKDDKQIRNETGHPWLGDSGAKKTCSVDIDGYNESLTVKGTARELANRINYLEE